MPWYMFLYFWSLWHQPVYYPSPVQQFYTETWIAPQQHIAPQIQPVQQQPITNPCGWLFINNGWIPSGRCGDTIYMPPCQVLSPTLSVCS